MALLNLLQATAPKLELIAEDLGNLDLDALEFVRSCGIPGMKVMVFAFDPNGESAYLPHNCQPTIPRPLSSSSTRPGRRSPALLAATCGCGRTRAWGGA